MVEDAIELWQIHKNIVIKIPMIAEGLKAVSQLSAKGIKTNVTFMFSAAQALIVVSIRGPQDAVNSALAGADISTFPYKVICQMLKHPLADAGIEKFLKDWEGVPNN